MNIKLIIFGLSFIAAFIFFWKVLTALLKYLKNIAVPTDKDAEESAELLKNFYMLVKLRPLLKVLSPRVSRLPIEEYRLDIKRKLLIASIPEDITADEFIAFKIIMAIAFMLIGLIVSRANIVFVIISLLFGFFSSDFQLKGLIEKKSQKILRELPYVLDLLSLSVNAGLDFGAALSQVADEKITSALHKELKTTLQEIRLGKSRGDALTSMARRLNHQEVSAFVSALVQADRLGVGLSETLEKQASQMRLKRFQLAEKLAAEAPIKMLFPMIIFIFPGVLIIVLGPLLLKMFAGLF